MSDDRVERVALAIETTMFAPHELPLDAETHAKYLETARAAIIIADAEPDDMFGGIYWVPTPKGMRSATPGECAKEITRLRARVRELEAWDAERNQPGDWRRMAL